jgi:hypothetical protein
MNECGSRNDAHFEREPQMQMEGQQDTKRSRKGYSCFVADFDNLTNNRETNPHNPQAQVDVLGLIQTLRAEGITKGTVVKNRSFSAVADAIWNEAGYETKSCHRNVDGDVIDVARSYAQDPCLRTLVILGSDHVYTPLVSELQARGIRVLVWGIKRKFCRRLKAQANNIRYLDRWVSSPPPGRSRSRKQPRCNSPARLAA